MTGGSWKRKFLEFKSGEDQCDSLLWSDTTETLSFTQSFLKAESDCEGDKILWKKPRECLQISKDRIITSQ